MTTAKQAYRREERLRRLRQWIHHPRLALADALYERLADYGRWGSNNPDPPGTGAILAFGPEREHYEPCDTKPGCKVQHRTTRPAYVASFGPDQGHRLWLGTPDNWDFNLERPGDALALAWFILWTWWAKGTWCGLRPRLWYWALHQRVESYKTNVKAGRSARGDQATETSAPTDLVAVSGDPGGFPVTRCPTCGKDSGYWCGPGQLHVSRVRAERAAGNPYKTKPEVPA